MRISMRDYPTIANLLLIPVQWALIWALPGMGLSGGADSGQRAVFVVLVWAALILEFPALSLHMRLARGRGVVGGLSRFLWALVIFRVILLLVLGVLALDAVGLAMTHWTVQVFVPVYGVIYVLFCLLTVADRSPSAQDAPPMRQAAIGVFAAFWNLVVITSLWNVMEAEFSAGRPLSQAQTLVIVAMVLLAIMLYVPARLPYLIVEQAGIGQGIRRVLWYAVFLANIVVPIVAAYTR